MPRRRPDSFAEKIGERMARLRTEKKLTQEQLGYGGDIAKGTMSELERGLVRPSVPMLVRIAQVLEVDVLDLVTFPDEHPRHELIDATRSLSLQAVRRLLVEATAAKRSAGSVSTDPGARPSPTRVRKRSRPAAR